MNYVKVVYFVIFCFTTAKSQLLCYNCDDCESDNGASVEPCGFSASVATTYWPGQPGQWNPWDPTMTPPYHPSTIYPPGNGGTNQNYCFMTQWNSPCYQYLPCDPNYPVMPCYPHYPMPQCDPYNTVYPCFISTGSVGGGGGGGGGIWDLATPPVTPWPWWPAAKEANQKEVASMEKSSSEQFGCLSLRSKVGDRDVVRRGCTRLESSNDETCNKATGGKHQKCAVCTTQLCNSETF